MRQTLRGRHTVRDANHDPYLVPLLCVSWTGREFLVRDPRRSPSLGSVCGCVTALLSRIPPLDRRVVQSFPYKSTVTPVPLGPLSPNCLPCDPFTGLRLHLNALPPPTARLRVSRNVHNRLWSSGTLRTPHRSRPSRYLPRPERLRPRLTSGPHTLRSAPRTVVGPLTRTRSTWPSTVPPVHEPPTHGATPGPPHTPPQTTRTPTADVPTHTSSRPVTSPAQDPTTCKGNNPCTTTVRR